MTKCGFTTTTTYNYSDDGNRVEQSEKIGAGAPTRTIFHVDPHNHTGYAQVLEEGIDDNGNGSLASAEVDKSYAMGHDLLSESTSAAATAVRLFVYDGHGSTRMLLANPTPTTVTVHQRYAYDAYGNQLTGTGLTSADLATTRFLYSGERTDKTGLQYLRARYYDPRAGRFTQLDPFAGNIQDPLSLHKYLYVHGDPISMTDPTGEFSVGVVGSLTIGIGALGLVGVGVGYYTKEDGGCLQSIVPGFGSGRGLGAAIAEGDPLAIGLNGMFLALDLLTIGGWSAVAKGVGKPILKAYPEGHFSRST